MEGLTDEAMLREAAALGNASFSDLSDSSSDSSDMYDSSEDEAALLEAEEAKRKELADKMAASVPDDTVHLGNILANASRYPSEYIETLLNA